MKSPYLPTNSYTNWWLRIASNSVVIPQETVAQRELARRSDLVAWLSLGLLGVLLIVSPLAIGDFTALLSLLGFLVAIIVATGLNRTGHVLLATVILVFSID